MPLLEGAGAAETEELGARVVAAAAELDTTAGAEVVAAAELEGAAAAELEAGAAVVAAAELEGAAEEPAPERTSLQKVSVAGRTLSEGGMSC